MVDNLPELPEEENGQFLNRKSPKGFNRFFQKMIDQFFKKSPSSDVKLSGRIHELHMTADKTLEALSNFKKNFISNVDPELFELACGAMDPLINEMMHIQKALENKDNFALQVKSYQRYSEWIDKTKSLVELCDNPPSEDVFYRVIITHIVKEFQSRIDRDIQIVEDYLDHAFDSLEIADSLKGDLVDKLEVELAAYLTQLMQLKQSPEEFNVHGLSVWKLKADHLRESIFSSCLHVIDSFVSGLREPVNESEKMEHTDHETEILVRLSVLEEQIIALSAMCESDEDGLKKMLLVTLEKLEKEAHNINSDLRLPQEHSDRVQKALDILAALRIELP